MVGQYGTHVDPPAHFAENGITMDEIPLKQMILPLVVLDDTPYLAKDPNHAFSVADLKAWETPAWPHAEAAPSSRCAPTCTRTGTRIPSASSAAPFPAWSFETIKFLYEQRGVTATGHEAMDTDTTDKMDSETYILQHGHYQIEVMANLDKVPATGALIVVTWPKVAKAWAFRRARSRSCRKRGPHRRNHKCKKPGSRRAFTISLRRQPSGNSRRRSTPITSP